LLACNLFSTSSVLLPNFSVASLKLYFISNTKYVVHIFFLIQFNCTVYISDISPFLRNSLSAPGPLRCNMFCSTAPPPGGAALTRMRCDANLKFTFQIFAIFFLHFHAVLGAEILFTVVNRRALLITKISLQFSCYMQTSIILVMPFAHPPCRQLLGNVLVSRLHFSFYGVVFAAKSETTPHFCFRPFLSLPNG